MQNTGTEELLNAINVLNLNLEGIDSSLRDIFSSMGRFYSLIQQYIPELPQVLSDGISHKYGSAVFGFLGVIVGAVIAYAFNKKINQQERMGRIAIQRKNLIYAPVYKELLRLATYIKENSDNVYLHILNKTEDCQLDDQDYYFDKKRREGVCFIAWNEMKNDIRKDYFPNSLQRSLEKINQKLAFYVKNRDGIEPKFKKCYEKYEIDESYKEAESKIYGKPMAGIFHLDIPAFLFKKDGNFLDGLERVKKDHGDFSQEEYNDFRKNLEDLFKYLTQEINRKDLFSSYEELVESINEAKIDVGKLIKHIIDKYEFGEKLKKYDV